MEIPQDITLADIRKGTKESGEGYFQRFFAFDPNVTLPQPIQEMTKDILRLLNPDNVWSLIGFDTIFINHFPEEPDRFTPNFYFDAKCPPRTVSVDGILRVVDLEDVFSYRSRKIVDVAGQKADIHVEKIGSVYPLHQALKELNSPYYLVSTTAIIEASPQDTPRLVVKAIMEDLLDFTSLEINRLRRAKRKLSK